MGAKIKEPIIVRSEISDEIYILDSKGKYCVTDQVLSAVKASNLAIPKDQYEQRLKADIDAILTNIKLELEEHTVKWYVGRVDGKSDDVVLIEDIEEIFKKYMEEATNEMP